MTIGNSYSFVIVGNTTVLVPDVCVRDNDDLAWVRDAADGPTNRYDRERARTGLATPEWADVWPVPIKEWNTRRDTVIGMWAPELAGSDDS